MGDGQLAQFGHPQGLMTTMDRMPASRAPLMAPPLPQTPQPLLDSDPADGPVSVAFGLKKELVEIRAKYPAPGTFQYLSRQAAKAREGEMTRECHPSAESDVCGWVMATSDPNGSYGGRHPDNEISAERTNLHFDNFRLIYQCVSGTALLHWASVEDFKAGIFGARRAPRPIAWWDLRKAYDVVVQLGDPSFDMAAAQFTILMHGGNLGFAVEGDEDVPVWYNAVRSVIRDCAWHEATRSDTPERRRRRWAAAKGVASALLDDRNLASRAMAILFHCYDTDMDCNIRLGEAMLLIVELYAGLLHAGGTAEGSTMEVAMQSAQSRLPPDVRFEKALRFRRRCDQSNDGNISKDEFVQFGQFALLEALEL
ncbi:unnamed protein product [Symbiodinium natans]|uniref:EF-hand domain-containing protein n=1 Tax=Symbiodinium natans TaxID=878477 RepID=A0A812HVE6_9DINO|nr:unnamed protein product [Symbiodinium natans]